MIAKKKTKKMKDWRPIKPVDVSMYRSYEDIPAAKLAWITMRAKQQGKSPKMAHAGVKAHFSRIRNEAKKSW